MKVFYLEQRQYDVPDNNDWLSANERVRLNAMPIEKRRRDWRLGRWTAKLGLATFHRLTPYPGTLSSIEVRSAPSGAPEVFLEGKRALQQISLSHSGDRALLALSPEPTSVGCDLEKVEPRSPAFVEDYFTDDEQKLIIALAEPDRSALINLIWSAKESALKVLGIGLNESTHTVEVLFDSKPSLVAGRAGTWSTFCVRHRNGRLIHGLWRERSCFIQTLASRSPFDPAELLPGWLSKSKQMFMGHRQGRLLAESLKQ